jgi:hypothetical protein
MVAVALTACAQSGYDASEVRGQLGRAGVIPSQARCVTDALERNFSRSELGLHVGATAHEIAVVRGLLKKCGVPVAP